MLAFLSIFRNLPWKWIAIGAATIALCVFIWVSVNGFYNQQRQIVEDLRAEILAKEERIQVQQEQIAGLTIDNDRLRQSNASISAALNELEASYQFVLQEIETVRTQFQESDARRQALERLLNDYERNERIASIREGRRAQLLLEFMNDNIDCWIKNFNNVGGRCIQGRWVPD